METLIIHTKSKSNARLLSALARKLGEKVAVSYADVTETHLASERTLAKDWLTDEEETAWQDL